LAGDIATTAHDCLAGFSGGFKSILFIFEIGSARINPAVAANSGEIRWPRVLADPASTAMPM